VAAPQASASLDKSTYNPGDVMTLTVSYSDPDTAPGYTIRGSVSIVVRDAEGNSSSPVVAPYEIPVPPVDPPGSFAVGVYDVLRTWTKVSDSGSTAVFTAVA
jgi:DNA gyrase inhibitor GyrI